MASAKRTRNSGNIDVDFPNVDYQAWVNFGHLPTFGEVIGAVKGVTNKRCSAENGCKIIASALVNHWTERNVYPRAELNVQKKIFNEFKDFLSTRKKLIRQDRPPTADTLLQYSALKEKKDRLFDIFIHDNNLDTLNKKRVSDRLKTLQEMYDVTMSSAEIDYLESQRSEIPRSSKIQCFPKKNDVDPAWQNQQERKKKRLEYEEKQRTEQHEPVDCADIDECMKSMDVSGSSSEGGNDTDSDCDVMEGIEFGLEESGSGNSKRKRKYHEITDNGDDPLPKKMRHVRSSERMVHDDIYLAATDLLAIGLSPKESLKAIEIVSNRVFERSFHQVDSLSKLDPINQNTLPTERSIRDMAERVEAHGLAVEAKEILTRKDAGDVITHAGDSTTKRHVGKFYVSGLHVNNERAIPYQQSPFLGKHVKKLLHRLL